MIGSDCIAYSDAASFLNSYILVLSEYVKEIEIVLNQKFLLSLETCQKAHTLVNHTWAFPLSESDNNSGCNCITQDFTTFQEHFTICFWQWVSYYYIQMLWLLGAFVCSNNNV